MDWAYDQAGFNIQLGSHSQAVTCTLLTKYCTSGCALSLGSREGVEIFSLTGNGGRPSLHLSSLIWERIRMDLDWKWELNERGRLPG